MVTPFSHPSRWIAVGLLIWCWAMIAFSLASVFLPGQSLLPEPPPSPANFIAACSVFVALPTVGAILAILRPTNPIGWLFLLCGFGFTFSIFTTEYVGRAVFTEVDLPGAALVDWVGSWIGTASIALALVWIPLLFPDGHLPGPRWRPVAWVAGAWLLIGTLSIAILPDEDYGGRFPNPVGVPGPPGELAAVIAQLYFPAMIVLGILALTSVVVRFARSRGVERQQLKWFLFAVVFLVAAFLVAVIAEDENAWYAVLLGLASLPIAAAVAILRYRLYDIDRLVSRTIAYTILTGGLIAVYLVVNLGLTALLSTVTRGDAVAVAASTLVVAALFTPVRRRVQSLVDHRFDRARYDAERTALAFGSRLRDQVDLTSVTVDLHDTVHAAIAPQRVGLWLRGDLR